jgi:hypothetical protein
MAAAQPPQCLDAMEAEVLRAVLGAALTGLATPARRVVSG